jgi:hypothetical protein
MHTFVEKRSCAASINQQIAAEKVTIAQFQRACDENFFRPRKMWTNGGTWRPHSFLYGKDEPEH